MARFRKYTSRRRPVADINITNLVDVTLVLLIIFIIVAPMLKQGLDIRLPEVKVADQLGQRAFLVEMDRRGVLSLNGETITLETLESRLKERRAAHPDWPVYLRTDGQNTVQSFTDIVSSLRAAGVDSVSLVTEAKERS